MDHHLDDCPFVLQNYSNLILYVCVAVRHEERRGVCQDLK